jgi:hypothetical protein
MSVLNYSSIAVRGFVTFVGTMSSIMAKVGPEIGITPGMIGMDSRAAAAEWTGVFPWKDLGVFPMDGVALRYFCAVWLWATLYCVWNKPILGGAMWTWFFILADVTVIGVSQLSDAMPNPNCPTGAPYCEEVFYTHCILGSMGLIIIALELFKGSGLSLAPGETKKAR